MPDLACSIHATWVPPLSRAPVFFLSTPRIIINTRPAVPHDSIHNIPAQPAAQPDDVYVDGRGRREQHLQLRLPRLLRAVLGLRQPERHRQAVRQRQQRHSGDSGAKFGCERRRAGRRQAPAEVGDRQVKRRRHFLFAVDNARANNLGPHAVSSPTQIFI